MGKENKRNLAKGTEWRTHTESVSSASTFHPHCQPPILNSPAFHCRTERFILPRECVHNSPRWDCRPQYCHPIVACCLLFVGFDCFCYGLAAVVSFCFEGGKREIGIENVWNASRAIRESRAFSG